MSKQRPQEKQALAERFLSDLALKQASLSSLVLGQSRSCEATNGYLNALYRFWSPHGTNGDC